MISGAPVKHNGPATQPFRLHIEQPLITNNLFVNVKHMTIRRSQIGDGQIKAYISELIKIILNALPVLDTHIGNIRLSLQQGPNHINRFLSCELFGGNTFNGFRERLSRIQIKNAAPKRFHGRKRINNVP